MFPFPSLTKIVCCIFVAYIGHSAWTIYSLFHPTPCVSTTRLCLKPFLANIPPPQLELYVYTSTSSKVNLDAKLDLLWKYENFSVYEPVEKVFNVSIPKKTRNNGTLYAHVFTCPVGESPIANSWTSYAKTDMTTYAVPASTTYNLMGSSDDAEDQETNKETKKTAPRKKDQPVTHWRTKLVINVVDEIIYFDRMNIPGDIARFLRLSPENEVLPMLYIDQLSNRIKDLVAVNKTTKKQELTVRYQPISIGMLRMWSNLQEAMSMLHGLGFSEKDTDEVKGIFADTGLYLLLMTFLVAAFHLLFDFLAFKNDISYWKKRDTMVGLSSRAVVWRSVSTVIIFLYLMDQETSLLVLIPAGIGTIIELWKVTKAFKVKVRWSGLKPSLEFGATSDKEKETQQFDSQAMKYLSYVLYPLVLAGAVYSLIYTPHKSWYSWCVQSMVNGVYALGFLFMLPQLFVNYKLKSVAHLPWRAFMYKAFNTFIDDIFAFIITMPTAHRVACFRDDIVFLVYLYQRWLYPVDKTRVNEYGQSFDEDTPAAGDQGETKKTK